MSILSHSLHSILSAITVDGTGNVDPGGGFFVGSLGQILIKVADTIIFFTAAISTLMIIIGGIRYAISAGNSGEINKAKDSIIYAIVGVVISAAAFAVVNGGVALLSK